MSEVKRTFADLSEPLQKVWTAVYAATVAGAEASAEWTEDYRNIRAWQAAWDAVRVASGEVKLVENKADPPSALDVALQVLETERDEALQKLSGLRKELREAMVERDEARAQLAQIQGGVAIR